MRPLYRWNLRSQTLDLGQRTLIMGVVNVTPDSFSDGGHFFEAGVAVMHALRLLDEGADIIDVGGESTRPGASIAVSKNTGTLCAGAVTEDEELGRILPVVHGVLKARPAAVISVDTYKSGVARAAVEAGAQIVNDVSGFLWDPQMASTCSGLRCGVILMHTRGRPEQWRHLRPIPDLTEVVKKDLSERVRFALESGVQHNRIVLDPGFGFGKNLQQNFPLLARFGELHELMCPLLAGTSRKSFVGQSLRSRTGNGAGPGDRLFGSLAAMVATILAGAHVVRVHDVKPSLDAAAVADDILAAAS